MVPSVLNLSKEKDNSNMGSWAQRFLQKAEATELVTKAIARIQSLSLLEYLRFLDVFLLVPALQSFF